MADLNRKSVIFKLIALILSIVCYGLFIGFHWSIGGTIIRLFVVAVFAGFMVLYIALTIGIFAGKEVDRDLCAIWALYATCAYAGVGSVLIVLFHNTNVTIGLVAGIMALVLSVITFLDCFFTLSE